MKTAIYGKQSLKKFSKKSRKIPDFPSISIKRKSIALWKFSTYLLMHVPELCQQKVQHSLILFTHTQAKRTRTHIPTHTHTHLGK